MRKKLANDKAKQPSVRRDRVPQLLSRDKMPSVSGLNVPRDYYVVCTDPILLGGMPYPWGFETPWAQLSQVGFRWVVCLADDEPAYDPTPLELAYCAELEDLAHGFHPRDAAKQVGLIRAAVDAVLWRIAPGHGVIVHCQGGRGRTGAVLGCILRELGVPARDVIAYLDSLHKLRGSDGWPESDWQRQVVEGWPTGNTTTVEPTEHAGEQDDGR